MIDDAFIRRPIASECGAVLLIEETLLEVDTQRELNNEGQMENIPVTASNNRAVIEMYRQDLRAQAEPCFPGGCYCHWQVCVCVCIHMGTHVHVFACVCVFFRSPSSVLILLHY